MHIQPAIRFPDHGDRTREWMDGHPTETQALLAGCKGRYPLCLCQAEGIKMYIAQRQTFYLARMPNTGPLHAPFCPSFEPDPAMSGRAVYSPEALTERSDGKVSIHLDAAIAIRSGGGGGGGVPGGGEQKAQRDTVGLQGLLNLLWERAEFSRWSPRMEGRRHYPQLYKYLYEASDDIIAKRRPLREHLYIPEPFNYEEALTIEGRRQTKFRQLTQTTRGESQRMLVTGIVKNIQTSEHGVGLRLAHTPSSLIFWLNEIDTKKFRNLSAFAAQDWPQLGSLFNLVVMLLVERGSGGAWRAKESALMVVTPQYLPAYSLEEARVIQALIEAKRHFFVPLQYDAKVSSWANLYLVDGAEPLPMEINRDEQAGAVVARNERIARYEEEGRAYWLWEAARGDQITALPGSGYGSTRKTVESRHETAESA